jgi:DNA-binding IclR family transcriptional regulator
MGAAVFDASGSPAWAVSITGVESRYRAERRKELGPMLLKTAHAISTKLRGGAAGG